MADSNKVTSNKSNRIKSESLSIKRGKEEHVGTKTYYEPQDKHHRFDFKVGKSNFRGLLYFRDFLMSVKIFCMFGLFLSAESSETICLFPK